MDNRSSPHNIEDRPINAPQNYTTQGRPRGQGDTTTVRASLSLVWGGKGKESQPSPRGQGTPDLEQTKRFLTSLDPDPDARFVFQTFDDGPNERRGLAKTFSGTFEQHKAELARLNRQGAGIFVTINHSNGGRKASDITGVRALFADFDHGAPSLEHAPLKPSLRVRSSKGKAHWYWLVDGLEKEEFEQLQLSIAAMLGSDPAVKDLPRVMRLPGFFHKKDPDNPHLVELIDDNGHRYSAEEVRDKLTWKGDVKAATGAWKKIHESCSKIAGTAEGSRNDTLNTEAFKCSLEAIRHGLDDDIVRGRLTEAGEACGLPLAEIESTLDSASKGAEREAEDVPQGKGRGKDRALIEFAKNLECFVSKEGDVYATVEEDGIRKVLAVDGAGFRKWLIRKWYERNDKLWPARAVNDTLAMIEAMVEEPTGGGRDVYLRVANVQDAGSVYIDLCNDRWQVIEVTRDGWRILDKSPVMFVRNPFRQPLPVPVPSGSPAAAWGAVNKLGKYLNTDNDGLLLCIAWLLGVLAGVKPYPILILQGVQGSGKSTASRLLRSLVDPCSADGAGPPKDTKSLMVAARSHYLLDYDNLSGIKAEIADGLCRLSTGGSLGDRKLYTDKEQSLFKAQRPVIINGIDDLTHRGDLAERAIVLELSKPAGGYKSEAGLEDGFKADAPAILGGLLDLIANGLGAEPRDADVRMGDFASWVCQCLQSTGQDQRFLSLYKVRQGSVQADAVEASPVGRTLVTWLRMEFTRNNGVSVEIPASTLFGKLGRLRTKYGIPYPGKAWPQSTKGLSNTINRLVPGLDQLGITVERKRTKRGRFYVFSPNNRFQPMDDEEMAEIREAGGYNEPF